MFDLPVPEIDTLDGYVFDSEKYEKLIARQNGNLDLGTMSKGSMPEADFSKYMSIMMRHSWDIGERTYVSLAESSRDWVPQPKQVDRQGLAEDLLVIYQQMYANYAISKQLGTHKRVNSREIVHFPKYHCGPATRDLIGSQWLKGEYHACIARVRGHVYGFKPYLVEDLPVIAVFDPTSDQLGQYKGNVSRNLMFLTTGKWSYKTDGSNKELFPSHVLHFGLFLDNWLPSGRICDEPYMYFKDGKKFLKECYSANSRD